MRFALAAFCVAAAASAAEPPRQRVIVALAHDARTPEIDAQAKRVIDRFEPSSMTVTARWRNVPAFAAEVDEAALERLRADPNVLRVDADVAGGGGLAQSVPLINGPQVRERGYSGRGVTVAVLDSGIDVTHPDLTGRIVDQQCFCTNSDGTGCCPNGATTQSGSGAGIDDYGHGTNVAGVIASRGVVASYGVAPDVDLISVKVLDHNNRFASTAQVISGLDWVIEHHPEVRVVNMSLLTDALFNSYCDDVASFTMAFAAAIRTLRSRGCVVTVCSGNTASSTSIGAPACVADATSVGAVYDADVGARNWGNCNDTTTTADQITCFSNGNATLDLLAPGALITSDAIGGGTLTWAGTSDAAPHVAGAAAILISMQPWSSADRIETILKQTGKPIVDARNGVTTPRIDVLAAVNEALRPAPARRRAAQ